MGRNRKVTEVKSKTRSETLKRKHKPMAKKSKPIILETEDNLTDLLTWLEGMVELLSKQRDKQRDKLANEKPRKQIDKTCLDSLLKDPVFPKERRRRKKNKSCVNSILEDAAEMEDQPPAKEPTVCIPRQRNRVKRRRQRVRRSKNNRKACPYKRPPFKPLQWKRKSLISSEVLLKHAPATRAAKKASTSAKTSPTAVAVPVPDSISVSAPVASASPKVSETSKEPKYDFANAYDEIYNGQDADSPKPSVKQGFSSLTMTRICIAAFQGEGDSNMSNDSTNEAGEDIYNHVRNSLVADGNSTKRNTSSSSSQSDQSNGDILEDSSHAIYDHIRYTLKAKSSADDEDRKYLD